MVIAIIGVLAGLLLPALSRAKQKALTTRCANSLKQYYMAFRLYADDFDDRFPNKEVCYYQYNTNGENGVGNDWHGTLADEGYFPDGGSMPKCPGDNGVRADGHSPYSLNNYLLQGADFVNTNPRGYRWDRWERPDQTWMLMDGWGCAIIDYGSWVAHKNENVWFPFPHLEKNNCLTLAGTVKALDWDEMDKLGKEGQHHPFWGYYNPYQSNQP